jgi:hypothetical protein
MCDYISLKTICQLIFLEEHMKNWNGSGVMPSFGKDYVKVTAWVEYVFELTHKSPHGIRTSK